MTDEHVTGGTDGTPPLKLTAEQKNALAMNELWDRDTGQFLREPDQVTDAGLIVYDLADPDTDHQDTLLVIWPTGGTAVMTRGMNLPEGVT